MGVYMAKKKIRVKDLVIILLSAAALAVLIYIVRISDDTDDAVASAARASAGSAKQERATETAIDEDIVINEAGGSGYVELYNRGSQPVALDHLTLKVNGNVLHTFQKSDAPEAGGYLVLELPDAKQLFGSDSIVSLCDQEDQVLGALEVPALKEKESYARSEDGKAACSLMQSTKGSANEKGETLTPDTLQFSLPGGFYEEEISLSLRAGDHTNIYYTLDGSTPDERAEKYKGPILLSNKSGQDIGFANYDTQQIDTGYVPSTNLSGVVVRAIAIDKGGKKSDVVTRSYYIGMQDNSAFRDLPVVSLTTAPDNLFDYFDGMYVSGVSYENALAKGTLNGNPDANYLRGWTKPACLEYFEPGKSRTYSGTVDLNITVDDGVSTEQKSIQVTKKKEDASAGSSFSSYFGNKADKVELYGGGADTAYKLREMIATSLLTDTGVGTARLMPCAAFINGEYWGIYLMKSVYTKSYIQSTNNLKGDDITLATMPLVMEGEEVSEETEALRQKSAFDETYAYVAGADLSNESTYAALQTQIDIPGYLDFLCANLYLANAGFRASAVTVWKYDGKWHWMMPEVANSMNNTAGTGRASSATINSYLMPQVSKDPFFKSLMQSQAFKKQLASTMKHYAEDVFSSEHTKTAVDAAYKQMNKKVLSNYKRFFGNAENDFVKTEAEKIQAFFDARGDYIMQYTNQLIEK